MNGESKCKTGISLYFHIPFCTKKCPYCHFYVIPNKQSYHDLLIEGLTLDIERFQESFKNTELVSIYFGGGTPALLEPSEMESILDQVRRFLPFDTSTTEITLEANPETLSEEWTKRFINAGINRLSIGVQTFDDKLLKILGRTHDRSKAIEAVEMAYHCGISNISIDLMYDLPGQSFEQWDETLKCAALLPISHLSLYNLTIEPHTAFFKIKESLCKQVPDEESSAKMYLHAVESLESAGLMQYEISAFCRGGMQSKHNVGYWTARPFLGFGPSAFSYWDHKRFRAVTHLNRYLHALRNGLAPIDFTEELEPYRRRRELLAIGLRLSCGVDKNRFEALHGAWDEETEVVLLRLIEEGLLEKNGSVFKLMYPKGFLFYDTVASAII